MVNKDITRLDLVKGATIFRQGHRDTLSFIPRNVAGEIVDLTGKVIDVVIVQGKNIVFEAVATFNSEDSTIQFTIDNNIGYGVMWMEFTVTDPADATYRQKFPTNERDGQLKFIRSADDLEYIGFSGKTVAQFEADQEAFKSAVEGDILTIEQTVQDGIGAFTEDTEVINARGGAVNLGARLDETAAQLAETETEVEGLKTSKADNERIDNIIAQSGTSSTEVVDARQSTAKSKTFTAVKGRLEEVETDTYFPAKNIITNGSFEANYSPWNVGGTTASVSGNKLAIDFTTTSSQSIIYPFARTTGHKYYGRFTFERVAGSFATEIDIFLAGINKRRIFPFNVPTVVSRIETAPSVGGSAIQLTFTTPTVGARVTISRPMFINLTETFGAGNEPTVEEMDLLVSHFPNSWFDGTVNLGTNKSQMQRTLSELRKRMLVDADKGKAVTIDLKKQNNELELSYGIETDEVNSSSIAYGSKSFTGTFVTSNFNTNSHFDNDLANYTVASGTPAVVTEVSNTPGKSLKVFGTTSQYVTIPFGSGHLGKKFFVAAKVRLDRFVTGSGIGFQVTSSRHTLARTIKKVTSGFTTLSGIYTIETGDAQAILGTMGSANADGYIDDFVIIDVTDIPNSDTTELTRLYETYLKIKKGEKTASVITKKYKLLAEEKNVIHEVDARNAFYKAMNAKAQEIGMTNTKFYNSAGGNDGGHKVTARDLLLMTIQAAGYEEMAKVWNKKAYTLNVLGTNARSFELASSVTDPALENDYFIIGGKTGTTTIQNLVVIVNAPNNNWFVGSIVGATGNRFEVAKNLFDIAKLYMTEGYNGTHDIAASQAAVALMPAHNPLSYSKYPIPLLWSKNADTQDFPASVTKVMTAMVMLDYVVNLHEKIEVQTADLADGSGPVLNEGDIVTFKDALYAMMLPSSNTLANTVARAVGEKIIRTTKV